MIVKLNQAFISVAKLIEDDTNNIFTQYAAGTIDSLEFKAALDTLATGIATASRTPKVWTAPQKVTAGGVSIVMDHPFGMSSIVAAVSAGSVATTPMQVGAPTGSKRATRHMETLLSGSWAVTAACSYISAKAQTIMHDTQPEVFKTGERASSYVATKQRLAQEIAGLDDISSISVWLPEEVGVVDASGVYLHRPVELTLISTFAESTPYSALSAEVQLRVQTWLDKAATVARLDPQLAGATEQQLSDAFAAVGVGFWLDQDLPWVKLLPAESFSVAIDPYTKEWLTSFSTYCVTQLNYYSRWFQAGTLLSDEEVVQMTQQWLILLRKLGVMGDWDMSKQYDSTYELYHSMLEFIEDAWNRELTPATFAALDMLQGKVPFSINGDTSGLSNTEKSELAVILSLDRTGFGSWPSLFKNRIQSQSSAGFVYRTSAGTDVNVSFDGFSPFVGLLHIAMTDVVVQDAASTLYLHLTRLSEICTALTAVTSMSEITGLNGDTVVITASAARWIQNLGPYFQPVGVAYIHPGYKL
jgi:hypothetical protein